MIEDDDEHLFNCLLFICMSSLVRYLYLLSIYWPIFKWVIFLTIFELWVLYNLNTSPLCFADILSQYWTIFSFSMVSFEVWKILDKLKCINIFFYGLYFGVIFLKSLPNPVRKIFSCVFFYNFNRILIILVLTFWFWSTWNYFLCMVWGKGCGVPLVYFQLFVWDHLYWSIFKFTDFFFWHFISAEEPLHWTYLYVYVFPISLLRVLNLCKIPYFPLFL